MQKSMPKPRVTPQVPGGSRWLCCTEKTLASFPAVKDEREKDVSLCVCVCGGVASKRGSGERELLSISSDWIRPLCRLWAEQGGLYWLQGRCSKPGTVSA